MVNASTGKQWKREETVNGVQLVCTSNNEKDLPFDAQTTRLSLDFFFCSYQFGEDIIVLRLMDYNGHTWRKRFIIFKQPGCLAYEAQESPNSEAVGQFNSEKLLRMKWHEEKQGIGPETAKLVIIEIAN